MLKPDQAEAAHTLDRHVSVTAGPGSGKTTVLVGRYLHILSSVDISVDQIVAITFTNRAANEMRARLRKELDRLLGSATPEERPRWMRHKRTLDGAIITTIHGLCSRLLREFPVEAGIDPRFALLDQHQSAMLEEAVVEEVLTGFINSGHEAITRLAAGAGRSKLAEALKGVYRATRNQGLTLDRVALQSAASHATAEEYGRSLNALDAAIAGFLNARRLTPAARRSQREVARRWPEFREMLATASTSPSLAEYCEAVEEFRRLRPAAAGRVADIVKALDELIWEKKLGGLVPRLCFDLRARHYAAEMISVVRRIEERGTEEKRRLSALDFDDLQLRVLKMLDEHPEVLRRTSGKYRYFLVDEFQDTNGLQRDLMTKLALGAGRRANLFIVGDRKQSVYGFRGADVGVFREMTAELESAGGKSIPLNLNFRSQPRLIAFLNHLFARLFTPTEEHSPEELTELGYVEHEPSQPQREQSDAPPLVELLIDVTPDDEQGEPAPGSSESTRERDARQLAARIISLVGGDGLGRRFDYRDVALLFRAMTEVSAYESAFRRAGIPYQTVQGKGFYEREEITDLIQLLRFLDNLTDELALAAVLRSPLCGISDDVLLALRRAPLVAGAEGDARLRKQHGVRGLFSALRLHEQIDFIHDRDRLGLARAGELLEELVRRRNRCSLAELLRFAASSTEYRSVISATFDGAQRLANVEKLFALAERFQRLGPHTIRDFVRFVGDFEKAGRRESEGHIDEAADAVRLMTIHQSKGLEFPVVIIPELQRRLEARFEWYLLDRHRGLTLRPPDGRGARVEGRAMESFRKRARLRERFESMRLLYVAATRARDRLILSGAVKEPPKSKGGIDSWLAWIWQALELDESSVSGPLTLGPNVGMQLTVNLLDVVSGGSARINATPEEEDFSGGFEPVAAGFPLLRPVLPERGNTIHRVSVTQLMNYQRCPRQYYFDRVLHAPTGEEVATWNDAEAPEPPANLTATLRGAIVHRFCEKYEDGRDVRECLRSSFDEVVRSKEAEIGDRLCEIDPEKAADELMSLARNYLGSRVRERIERVAKAGKGEEAVGVFSERRFRLRRPLAILTGTLDKLLVWRSEQSEGLSAEIIDFKTNRLRARGSGVIVGPGGQLALDFSRAPHAGPSLDDEVATMAADYRLQMQAYALAVRELMPAVEIVKVTLHFLDPDVEVGLPDELLEREACVAAVDRATEDIISSSSPDAFPVRPAEHCKVCSFVEFCDAGRGWLAVARRF